MDEFRGLRAHPIIPLGDKLRTFVYRTPVSSLDELKLRIVAAIDSCTANAGEHLEGNGLDILRAMKGAHVGVA
jgi:hypothetical protein